MSKQNAADDPSSIAPVHNPAAFLPFLLSHLQEGVILLDSTGRTLFTNPAAQRLTAFQPFSDILSPDVWHAFLPDGLTPFPPEDFPARRCFQGETVSQADMVIRPPHAAEAFNLHVTAVRVAEVQGVSSGCLLFLWDVTAHKHLEKDVLEISGVEKKRLGQELHDGVCQILTGIKFMCNVLVGKLAAKEAPEASDVTEIQYLVSQALMEADTIAKGMFPVRLEADGLTSAMEELAAHTARLYRISCRFLGETRSSPTNRQVALHVFRITQEAITNAVKHGRAKNIAVWLSQTNERFTLIVKDDGRVQAQPASRNGMGLRIMRYRADQIGATLHTEQLADGGTLLSCEFSDSPEHIRAKEHTYEAP